jgi:hypothetical protein
MFTFGFNYRRKERYQFGYNKGKVQMERFIASAKLPEEERQ